ncbi:M28 family peptidase [Pedobacter sp. MC2016-05]|uniref:M28 family metallopeptidase n=1 Tax=Pedobacter sp. MC2016-05 TaxID=2994474 RepID=UPI0022474CC9|nr:M28 family peptidase [Pedobacter sp. MC2016-05]MCX2475269.1 M28 family peptidase [Pedobacter sp. MC2016-05]
MKNLLLVVALFYSSACPAQDSAYTRKMVNKLTAKEFWGRGYTKDGMKKAADFIAEEYKELGLIPFGTGYKQDFNFPVNTFPGKMMVEVDGKKLIPGKDFIINNESPTVKLKAALKQIDSLNFQASPILKVSLKDKLTWSVATEVGETTQIQINKKALTATPERINVDIENKFFTNFQASNICGLVKGTKYPDSILMITAHYDHLGGMGKDTYFPGANDNAAGVATLLSLAKYYASNPQPYSIGFICFAAEEAGLLGSRYYTENPLLPLNKIKFLINLDLVGTGEAGMTVVNASVYPKAFSLLKEINDQHRYISKINSRGKAANSDHYFFSEKGVPAFFIYTQGGPSAYHDVFDQADTLPLNEYNDLFKLLVSFHKKLMK